MKRIVKQIYYSNVQFPYNGFSHNNSFNKKKIFPIKIIPYDSKNKLFLNHKINSIHNTSIIPYFLLLLYGITYVTYTTYALLFKIR